MALANQMYPFATTFKINQSRLMIDHYFHQNPVQLGKKGFKPLTCGFGDHCFTIRTIIPRKKRFLVYGICTYLCLFSNKFVTFLDFNWCFFFICLAYPKKLSAYECGFDPLDDAKGHFDIRFYLVSILFIIFDLEVTFLFPWTIYLNKIGLFGFWSMIVFLLILTIGFIYEWKKGTLDCE